jgi:hypothetical protein
MLVRVLLGGLAIGRVLAGTTVDPAVLDACPGYTASNVKVVGGTMTASLKLAGKACNVFGTDLASLSLKVVYETSEWTTIYSIVGFKRVLHSEPYPCQNHGSHLRPL